MSANNCSLAGSIFVVSSLYSLYVFYDAYTFFRCNAIHSKSVAHKPINWEILSKHYPYIGLNNDEETRSQFIRQKPILCQLECNPTN